MGKKILSQVQGVKISKSNSSSEKKQLNNLIKVLRPKVYITDSCSFKTLVQQLTGNGTGTTVSSPSPSPSSSSLPQIVEKVVFPVIHDVEEDDHGNPESSMESLSFDASLDESFGLQACNHLALSSELEMNIQGYNYDPMCFDETTSSSEDLFMNIEQEDSLAYGDLQALLLDVDHEKYYPNYSFNVYSQIHEQEVSIYDYELSGLI